MSQPERETRMAQIRQRYGDGAYLWRGPDGALYDGDADVDFLVEQLAERETREPAPLRRLVEQWVEQATKLRQTAVVDTPLSAKHWPTLAECAGELDAALLASADWTPEQIASANIRQLLEENQRLKQQAADDRANYESLSAERDRLEDDIVAEQNLRHEWAGRAEAAEAEAEQLRQEQTKYDVMREGYMAMANARVEAAEAQLQRCREALRDYGQHRNSCAVTVLDFNGRRPSGKPCDCGLAAALAERTP
jgi:hypothetical protein